MTVKKWRGCLPTIDAGLRGNLEASQDIDFLHGALRLPVRETASLNTRGIALAA
jgi:hypothetical protein